MSMRLSSALLLGAFTVVGLVSWSGCGCCEECDEDDDDWFERDDGRYPRERYPSPGASSTPTPSATSDAADAGGNWADEDAGGDAGPSPNCTTTADCTVDGGAARICLKGFCKYTCATDAYCRTIDNRIGYCAKDGVCRSAAEASASCLVPADCNDGGACVDNVCK